MPDYDARPGDFPRIGLAVLYVVLQLGRQDADAEAWVGAH